MLFCLLRFGRAKSLHIRTYDSDVNTGRLFPIKAGVTLNSQQVKDLHYHMPMIRVCLENSDDSTAVKYHVGKNTYVEVVPERGMVDFRHYFYLSANELHPTRRGIQIDRTQYDKLEENFSQILSAWGGEMNDNTPCFLTHDSEESFRACCHCNPPYDGE